MVGRESESRGFNFNQYVEALREEKTIEGDEGSPVPVVVRRGRLVYAGKDSQARRALDRQINTSARRARRAGR